MAQYKRIPLTINALFLPDGTIKPKKVIMGDNAFVIDRIIRVKSFCPKVVPAIAPIEYTVMVEGCEKKIYFEPHSSMWFSVKEA